MQSKFDTTTFRAGWARGMRAISSGDNNAEFKHAIYECHTDEYCAGYSAALDHFDGRVTHGTELGHELGLVQAYEGFHGQQGWEHPIELPGCDGDYRSTRPKLLGNLILEAFADASAKHKQIMQMKSPLLECALKATGKLGQR